MVLSTVDYLYKNKNGVVSAIHFTINDLAYIKRHKLEAVVVNYNKPTEETLAEKDVAARLSDLYKLASISSVKAGFDSCEEYMENLKDVFERLEADFDVKFNLD